MVSCSELPQVVLEPRDLLLDRAWLALQRGDGQGLEAVERDWRGLAEPDPLTAERLALDGLLLRAGRAAALVEALDRDSPWAGRYLASDEAAREWLDEHVPPAHDGLVLERSRRAGSAARRRSLARAQLVRGPGRAQALAQWIEALQAAGRLAHAEELLDQAPDTARLAWVRRRQALATGRPLGAALGLVEDLERDRITPGGLDSLAGLLQALPDAELEDRAAAALAAGDLAARPGALGAAAGRLAALLARRRGASSAPGQERLAGAPRPPGPEERLEADPRRASGDDLARLAVQREWALAARAAYAEVLAGGEADLDDFLQRLDRAAAGLPDAPRLADLPRRDLGLLGTLLDPGPLEQRWPDVFLLGGQGLFQPAELTLYDVLDRRPRQDGEVRWLEHHVARQRVPGFVASQGGVFTGAGILDRVFLDRELLDDEVRRLALLTAGPDLPARPAADTAARRSLAEPLDVARALRVAAVADAGERLEALVLEALSLHEGQHILDAQEFLGRGVLGRLGMVLSGGLLPANLRAALERRAQLRALRRAEEPRLVLADCVARLPLEGAALSSEHAVGYAALVADLIEVLDRGAWEGARPLDELGLDRGRNLLQQLHRLDVPTLRALAEAVPD